MGQYVESLVRIVVERCGHGHPDGEDQANWQNETDCRLPQDPKLLKEISNNNLGSYIVEWHGAFAALVELCLYGGIKEKGYRADCSNGPTSCNGQQHLLLALPAALVLIH